MAGKFPYVSSAGPLLKGITHLRRSFPKEVTAETLRKLGVAPKNESYVINVLRFLGVIDSEGKKVDAKAKALLQHEDSAFATEFGMLVKEAYEEIFELHGDAAWKLDRGALTQFFRTTDHSTDVVGSRQASTFMALAALSGHAALPQAKPVLAKTMAKTSEKTKATARALNSTVAGALRREATSDELRKSPVGLTVRIEVNLPAAGDQETYDRIFASIRRNLLNG